MNNASPHVQWSIIRNNSCFLRKGQGHTFSCEPNNLKCKNTFKFNGLIHDKTVGIEATKDGKGVVLVTKKIKGARNKPIKQFTRVELKKDARRTLTSIRHILKKNKYRRDIKNSALRRASAILRSQKPVIPMRKKRAPRNKRH
ncbi:large ribosomal subunit protein eL28-like [Asterias amurensis]|uniref:large ribosomal subunit protein eL28-like n=1 Tax=Asterias amurensis TaxID=7602 RepID=UPI003AB47499